MSFVIPLDYNLVATKFCEYYYSYYNDNDPVNLSKMFNKDCYITYLGDEIIGFNSLYSTLQRLHYNIFNFSNLVVNAQPILLSNNILISIVGDVNIKNSV